LFNFLERVKRIELSQPAWKAGVLPLNYTRSTKLFYPQQPCAYSTKV
jgi:hypothetical protein